MEITLRFSGNKRVDALFGDRVVHTDQAPEHGGEGSAPEPFQLFLASLATCAGVYVLGFCQARDLPTDGIRLVQRHDFSEDGRLRRVTMQISVPADFPSKYVPALERVAAKCTVKRVIQEAPEFVIEAKPRGSEAALDAAAP